MGGSCLSDIEALRGDPGTLSLLGVEALPAPGRWANICASSAWVTLAAENLIKEYKPGLSLAKLPTKHYLANWTYLLIGQLAYNLTVWFKRQCLPKRYQTATLKTLRYHLFNLAGKIVASGREFFLMLSDENRYQDVWRFAPKQLAEMKPDFLSRNLGCNLLLNCAPNRATSKL